MRSPTAKTLIIGFVLCTLAACSAIRLSYDNGVTLAALWIDGWLDLDSTQSAQLKAELQPWFDWHRASELPRYVPTMAQWRERVGGDVSAAEVCAAAATARGWARRALDEAAPAAARLLPGVRAAQWSHLIRRQQERIDKLRREMLPPGADERRRAMLGRWVKRAEEYYGTLSNEQRALLAADVAASPRDPQAWIVQREARQRELVDALRRVQQLPDAAARTQALRDLAARELEPPTSDAAGQEEARWREHLCATTARLHNSTTPVQRVRLQRKLQGWEEDFSALAG